jgi:ATP synthase protein I
MSEEQDRASLEELDRKLTAVEGRREETHRPEPGARGKSSSRGMALGMRISAEMVAAILVGLIIGWVLDRVLGTMPWLLVLFVLLGAGAGGLNAYRAAKGYDSAIGLGRAMGKRKQGDKD